MNILSAGASGFIGKELTRTLSKSHSITVLGRKIEPLEECFPESKTNKITWDDLSNCDAKKYDVVINLCGSNIGDKRWTPMVKKELIASRTSTNAALVQWLIGQKASPHFLCANAVGYYGIHKDATTTFDEDTPVKRIQTHDFLNEIALTWEKSLQPAIDNDMRVSILRFGVVLKKGEGMLKKLALSFKLGLGSVLGHGSQVLSWVYYADLINAIVFLIDHPQPSGPINITSPNPVSQKDFAITFARTLKRPLFLTMPSFLVKILFGEMGECLLLNGQRVLPKKLTGLGFIFQYPELKGALEHEYHT